MSHGRATATTELRAAFEVLEEHAFIVSEGERAYRSSADRSQRVRYLWIVVGGRLKNYCQVMGIARPIGELGKATGFRHTLAHLEPDHVGDSIVWRTSEHDLSRLQEGHP